MDICKIFENISLPIDSFNVDCDGVTYKQIRHVVGMLINLPIVKTVSIYKAKRLHYHLKVKLNCKIPIWQTFILRLLCFDDEKRLRLDIRRSEKQPELIDYVGDIKISYCNNKAKVISKYELVDEVSK